MQQNEDELVNRVGQSLGASRVVALPQLPSRGPLDLLQLRAEVAQRLRLTSSLGTDPKSSVPRLVPVRDASWRQIEALAEELSGDAERISPGQLAAILIDRALGNIVDGDR